MTKEKSEILSILNNRLIHKKEEIIDAVISNNVNKNCQWFLLPDYK